MKAITIVILLSVAIALASATITPASHLQPYSAPQPIVLFSVNPNRYFLLKYQSIPDNYAPLVTVKISSILYKVSEIKNIKYDAGASVAGLQFYVKTVKTSVAGGVAYIYFYFRVSGVFSPVSRYAFVTQLIQRLSFTVVYSNGESVDVSPDAKDGTTLMIDTVSITGASISVSNMHISGIKLGNNGVAIGPTYDVSVNLKLDAPLTVPADMTVSVSCKGTQIFSKTVSVPSGKEEVTVTATNVFIPETANVTVSIYGEIIHQETVEVPESKNAPVVMFTYTPPAPAWIPVHGTFRYVISMVITPVIVTAPARITAVYSGGGEASYQLSPGDIRTVAVRIPTMSTDITKPPSGGYIVLTIYVEGYSYSVRIPVKTMAIQPGNIVQASFLYLFIVLTVSAAVLVVAGVVMGRGQMMEMGIMMFIPAIILTLVQVVAVAVAKILVYMGAQDVLGVSQNPPLYVIINRAVTYIFQTAYSEGMQATGMATSIFGIAMILLAVAMLSAGASSIPFIGILLRGITGAIANTLERIANMLITTGILVGFVGVALQIMAYVYAIVFTIAILLVTFMSVIEIIAGVFTQGYRAAVMAVTRFTGIILLTVVSPYVVEYMQYLANNIPSVVIHIPIPGISFGIPMFGLIVHFVMSTVIIAWLIFVIYYTLRLALGVIGMKV